MREDRTFPGRARRAVAFGAPSSVEEALAAFLPDARAGFFLPLAGRVPDRGDVAAPDHGPGSLIIMSCPGPKNAARGKRACASGEIGLTFRVFDYTVLVYIRCMVY